jgi:hypothetical protein
VIKFCKCCGYDSFIKNGFDLNNNQRWKCKYCNKAFNKRNVLKKLNSNIAYKPVEKLTDFELYFLGFAIADGCVNRGKVQFTLNIKDKIQLDFFKNQFNCSNKISVYLSKSHNIYECWAAYKLSYFEEDLYHLGLMPRKTGNEMWLPYMESPHFVRGFFDGDGTIYTTSAKTKQHRLYYINRAEFTCSNNLFVENLNRYICKELNIDIRSINKKAKNNEGNFFIRFQGKYLLLFCEWLYKDSDGLRLERKYNKYLEIKNNG